MPGINAIFHYQNCWWNQIHVFGYGNWIRGFAIEISGWLPHEFKEIYFEQTVKAKIWDANRLIYLMSKFIICPLNIPTASL